MTIKVKLQARETRRTFDMATDRSESFKDIDKDKVDRWRSDEEYAHYFGLLAEWAFAKYYDIQLDNEIYIRTDGGVDFRVRIDTDRWENKSVDIDIKSSPVDDAELQVKTDNVEADHYVLCRFPQGVPDPETNGVVEIVGGATKEMLLRREKRWSPRHKHDNYHVSPKYLLELPSPDAVESVE